MAKEDVHSSQLTYEDYLLFPDDGKRHEVIDGDHYVTPAPRTKHQRISANLTVALGSFVKRRGMGLVLAAPSDVILSDENVVQPDLLFVSTARTGIVTEDNIRGAPDLVVEIIAETTRKKDEVTKRKLYERFGVQEYWVGGPGTGNRKGFQANATGIWSRSGAEQGSQPYPYPQNSLLVLIFLLLRSLTRVGVEFPILP